MAEEQKDLMEEIREMERELAELTKGMAREEMLTLLDDMDDRYYETRQCSESNSEE